MISHNAMSHHIECITGCVELEACSNSSKKCRKCATGHDLVNGTSDQCVKSAVLTTLSGESVPRVKDNSDNEDNDDAEKQRSTIFIITGFAIAFIHSKLFRWKHKTLLHFVSKHKVLDNLCKAI